MADEEKRQEPTMDEILGSIRRMIAADAEREPFPAPPGAGASGDDEDVLLLTEVVEEGRSAPPPVDHRLLSPQSEEAAVASLSQLAGRLGGESALETAVREALRPLLRDWLDRNLPHIVERAVRQEVERLAREAQGRASP